MSDFDPMDTTGQLDASATYSDDVDGYDDCGDPVTSYTDTVSEVGEVDASTTYEAAYDETTTYVDTTSDTQSYDATTSASDPSVGATEVSAFQPYATNAESLSVDELVTSPAPATAGPAEVSAFQPYATNAESLSVDELVTSPAPATAGPAEVSAFQPYATNAESLSVDELVTSPAPATNAQTPYDAFTTQDFEEWQAEYHEWNASLTTTGRDPLTVDDLVGEPYADAGFWFKQNTPYTCGPSVATQIISDFTGNVRLNETDLMNEVAANGWWVTNADTDPDIDGMAPENLAKLLTNNGVPSVYEEGKDIGDLVQYLSEGKAVVLAIDNENLPGATGEQDGPEGNKLIGANANPLDDANHVVRLVGIDTERGIAYLSDPGRADGKNLAVPLETLKEAWNDSKNAVIVSAAADPTPDQPATPTNTPPNETETPEPAPTETAPASTDATPQADREPAPAPAQAPAARPAAASTPSVVRTETVTTSMTPPADVAPLDLGVSDQINDMLQTAADAAAPPVDLTTPSSQPDGLFDSALGFVLIPVAVSAGVAGTLGYRQLRSNR
jgi:hypothetical protein